MKHIGYSKVKYIGYSKVNYTYPSWDVGTQDIDYILSNRRRFYFIKY